MAQTMAFSPPTRFFQGFGATIRVHPDHIGFICGKRFATLSEIGRATHTRVVVTNGDGNLKVITIGGRSVADVTAAHERLMHVAREAEARTPRVAEWSPAMTALHIAPLQGIEHRVVIQKEDVGMVLGAKGSTLRKLGNDTWTWVKFFKATDTTAPTFSIRGFLSEDVEKACTRMLSIAQESYNRRSGGPRHHRDAKAHEPMKMAEKAVFKMAPVPKSKRVSFKVNANDAASSPPFPPFQREPRSMPVMPQSPTYAPTSPHTPTSPTYTPTSPHTPHTPRTPPSA